VSTVFHNQVRLDGFDFQDAQFTVLLAAGIDNTMLGQMVTWDSSADNQMKLSGDGDPLHGRLVQVENRQVEGQLVGLVSFRFADKLPIKPGLSGGQIVARGSVLCGAAGGFVRTAVSGTDAAFSANGLRCVAVTDAGINAVAVKA
jgi:hypothetical protein